MSPLSVISGMKICAIAVEWLDHDTRMLGREGFEIVHRARDQRQRRVLGEPRRVCLLVHVPERLRRVDHETAAERRPIEDVGRVDVLDVERRVLAHQDDVDVAEPKVFFRAEFEPVVRIVAHGQPPRATPRFAGDEP